MPTNKTNFLFKNTEDFNEATHGRPQDLIVFIHNISLYFNCLGSFENVFKWSCHGYIMHFSAVQPKQSKSFSKNYCLHIVWKGVKVFIHSFEGSLFCYFYIPRWQWAIWNVHTCNFFLLFYIVFQFIVTSRRASYL